MSSLSPETANILASVSEDMQKRSHIPCGVSYKRQRKLQALSYLHMGEELKAILCLCESHGVTLRIRNAHSCSFSNSKFELWNQQKVGFDCPNSMEQDMQEMLKQVSALPKEWTIIQLTSSYNALEAVNNFKNENFTNAFHISVFDCGRKDPQPFVVTVDKAVNESDGSTIQFAQKLESIFEARRKLYRDHIKQNARCTVINDEIDSTMARLVKSMSRDWLKHWKILLQGKPKDEVKKQKIFNQVKAIFKANNDIEKSEKNIYILSKILPSLHYLLPNELRDILQYIIPNNKELVLKVHKEIRELQSSSFIGRQYPVILIVDENLDMYPWEMVDVMQYKPVCRMPTFHYTHALFKIYEKQIDTYAIKVKVDRGAYVVNPGLDLKRSQARLEKFFSYYFPKWKGIVGVTPASEDFETLLKSCDVFSYCGHGNGMQYVNGSRVQKLHINAVVFLFGCSSASLEDLGPNFERHGAHYDYLFACSPCVVGMLYAVTDFDVDKISADVISRWIPCDGERLWREANLEEWYKGNLVFKEDKSSVYKDAKNARRTKPMFELDLLEVANDSRREASSFFNQAALVIRGLPVIAT